DRQRAAPAHDVVDRRQPAGGRSRVARSGSAVTEVLRLKPVSWLGRLGLLLLLCAALPACSLLEGRKVDYESAARGKPLTVPPDLTQLPRDARYAPAPVASEAGTAQSPESAGKDKKDEPLSTPPDLTQLPQDTRYTVPG